MMEYATLNEFMGVVETQSDVKLSVDYMNPPLRMPDPELRECKWCDKVKPLEDFSISGRRIDGTTRRKNQCKDCQAKEQRKKRKLIKDLGLGGKISLAHPNGNATAAKHPPLGTVCDNPRCENDKTLLRFEHDHVTMVHRGWLCNECNMGFAYLGDNMEGLMESSKYFAKTMTKEDFEKPICELLKWSREKNNETEKNSERV